MKKSIRALFLASLVLPLASPSFAATFSIGATADAFVAFGPSGNLANNNYGGGNALALAAGGLTNGEFQSVIKFDLSGAVSAFNAQYGPGNWSIQSVSLQLTSSGHSNPIYNDIVPGQFGVSLMQNNSWLEGTGNASNPANNGITFNSLQNVFINNSTDQSLGTFSFPGGSSGANNYSLNLASGLTADILAGSNLSLRLFAADNQISYLFSARTTTPASSGPQLIITAVPEPGSLALFGFAFIIGRSISRLSGDNGTEPKGCWLFRFSHEDYASDNRPKDRNGATRFGQTCAHTYAPAIIENNHSAHSVLAVRFDQPPARLGLEVH